MYPATLSGLGDVLELAELERDRWPRIQAALDASGVPQNAYRKNQWRDHLEVKIDGVWVDYGYWAGFDGGGVDSDGSTYDDWDGEVGLGGKRTREDATMKKLYREGVHAVFRDLDSAAGGTDNARITREPVGDDGVGWGDPTIYVGDLKSVKQPPSDKSSADGGELEIVCKLRPELA